MTDEKTYTPAEIGQRLATALPAWDYAEGCLRRQYRTSGWKGALLVVNTIGHLAEAAWHHPDLKISYDSVVVDLKTHSANGITDKDFELAHKIEETVQWRPAVGSALEGTPDDPRFRYLYYD
jgi:pterin-4a-carbinolamine dehydratase